MKLPGDELLNVAEAASELGITVLELLARFDGDAKPLLVLVPGNVSSTFHNDPKTESGALFVEGLCGPWAWALPDWNAGSWQDLAIERRVPVFHLSSAVTPFASSCNLPLTLTSHGDAAPYSLALADVYCLRSSLPGLQANPPKALSDRQERLYQVAVARFGSPAPTTNGSWAPKTSIRKIAVELSEDDTVNEGLGDDRIRKEIGPALRWHLANDPVG